MNAGSDRVGEVFERDRLRRAFGAFPTGVTVLTCDGHEPHGMTANSFASVSLDPPLVLVCVGRDANMHRALHGCEHFGISVLAADQEPVARHFADRRRPLGAAQFDAVDWLSGPVTGVPLIGGAVAAFECRPWRSYDGGDHTIFTGRLLSMSEHLSRDALLFSGGRFRRFATESTEVPL
ncbi:flavin reductase [Actinomadura sp. CNU-125]|uniref:flavin reductase family protein n=1 Tax=Actinomadura sp. CNU-125 TaxID=1904961 RepID=UPI000964FFD4|nr:flavin reductase family protein [Actinomadura sp. CNU-125]OLT19139.1 flavin reductase [Actinomadura sp. CNU-125]